MVDGDIMKNIHASSSKICEYPGTLDSTKAHIHYASASFRSSAITDVKYDYLIRNSAPESSGFKLEMLPITELLKLLAFKAYK
jgi:hypothetical protein